MAILISSKISLIFTISLLIFRIRRQTQVVFSFRIHCPPPKIILRVGWFRDVTLSNHFSTPNLNLKLSLPEICTDSLEKIKLWKTRGLEHEINRNQGVVQIRYQEHVPSKWLHVFLNLFKRIFRLPLR